MTDIFTGIDGWIGQQAVNSIFSTYLTSRNLLMAGLALGGLGVITRPALRGISKGLIVLAVLLLIGAGILFFMGY